MKSKESKLQKAASSKAVIATWRDESLALSFQDCANRTCDVVLMVESEELCADVIYSCYMGYKLNPISPVKILTYTDLKMEVIEFVSNKDSAEKSGIYAEICAEAALELEKNDTIPAELLSHLIKIKIFRTINEDISMEQEKMFIQMVKDSEYKKIFESAADADGKKKKGKEKPAKSEKKGDGGKKKKGAGSQSEVASRISTSPPKPLSQFSKSIPHPEIQVENKHLYIILSGFYSPDLISELVKVGVPLCCLLEVSFTQSALYREDFFETTISENSNCYLDDGEGAVETDSDEDNLAVPPSSAATSASSIKAMKSPAKSFWSYIIDLIHLEQQEKYMEHIFHMFYKVSDYVVPEINSEVDELCNDIFVKQYENLTNFVMEIETLKRQYITYTRNLKLQKVPCAHTRLHHHHLRIYNKLMNNFPPDCFSIALLMACLVEEVCSRVPEVPSGLVVPEESHENLVETNEMGTKVATDNHGGFRDQIINVLGAYKNRYDPIQGNKSNKHPSKCYTCKYDPKIDLRIDSKCFMVHASNDLQIVMNCYKKLSKDLFSINMNGLKKCKAAILRSRHAVGIVLEKLMNEYNLQSWRKALNLTKDELCDGIHTFLLAKMKDNFDTLKSDNEIIETSTYPYANDNMLFGRFRTDVDYDPNAFDVPGDARANRMSFNLLYRNFSRNLSQILYPGSLSEYCYKEHLPGPVLLQELLKAGLAYEHIEQLYTPLTDTLLLIFHDDLNDFGCTCSFKKGCLRTPVCIRDFCEYILPAEKEWIEDQEFLYQSEYRKEVEELKRKKEELRKALYSEFIPDEFYFILPDSIKAQLLAKDEPAVKEVDKKKGGKSDKKDKKEKKKASESDKKEKKKDATSSKKSEAQLDIEDVLRKMPEVPEKRRLSLRCAEGNEPHTFFAYDLGSSQVQVNVWTTVFHSHDNLKVTVERTCWLGSTAALTIKLTSNDNSFIFHYRPDLVTTEPFMFHSILSDGACLAFSKPTKLKKIEHVICERICNSKQNKLKKLDENSAYQRKPQEIYFVSEKQDCVLKSVRIPFSTERSLVLSENLLLPFLDSLEKFNIRARVTVPPETLRQRQERRHNLRNRISTSATETKTSLSQYATAKKKKRSSRVGMVEKYPPKIIVHKAARLSTAGMGDGDFLKHSQELHKINTVPTAAVEIRKAREACEKIKQALAKHIPLFKICSSRLHKFTYVKRIKSYVNIPVGSVVKRILYKPNYYKTKRTIEIKKCLPLGCVNMTKIKKPAYSIRISLPSGLFIRDIPGVASEFPCIRQYYIDKGPQCKDIVHEESRTFLRNGNIAIKRCDGNINVLSANGRIFHFEIPYIMKTRTERKNYHDANVARLQKRHSPNISIHAARKSLTTFQKLLHRVLPRRFKHMIDSKESRYYLSRRAYLKAQKKYCTNIDMLYLLESQRQPFPEYSVITPDGKKIKVSKSKVYEEHKYYVATDIDFRAEETLFEREDGTCCILNREGVLTTQFPDGTRLTTWFVESANQVFADEIEDFHKKDAFIQTDHLNHVEQFRINTVNFDFNVDEGWVSIFMYYQYSHPNYATVVFGGEDNEMSVTLPNGCRVACREGHRTSVGIGKYIETEFDKRKFYMKARGCDNCTNGAHAVIDIGQWYQGKLPNNNTEGFIYVKDSFEKHFRVDYNGSCCRNPTDNTKTETNCNRHSVPAFNKLFSVKSDFSGCIYWSKSDFKSLMDLSERNDNFTVDTYSNGDDENAIVEFKEYVAKPYHERYICKYDEPTLKLAKYKTKHAKTLMNPAYILRKVLCKVVTFEKIEPLYTCILENCEKYGLRKKYENFELFFTHVTQQLPTIRRSLKKDDSECLDPCPCGMTRKEKEVAPKEEQEEMRRIQSVHDKWYKWQEECKKYKQLIKENYVPLYFKSKFGSGFSDETRKYDGGYVHPPRKEDSEEYWEEEEELYQSVKKSSSDIPKVEIENIDVKKEKSIERKLGKPAEKVMREQIHIKIPKNMVLLYNQGMGNKSVEISENKITARSDSKAEQSEDRPEKLLVLAGVRDASKVEIATKFLEMHPAAKKYERGSKIVIAAKESEVETRETIHPTELVEEQKQSSTSMVDVPIEELHDVYVTENESNNVLDLIEAQDEEEQPPEMIVYVKEESVKSVHEGVAAEETLQSDDETKPQKSASNVLKDVVMMSKELFHMTTDDEESLTEEAYSDSTKQRAMSVVSNLMKMLITSLSHCPENIPPKISESITASAGHLILDANLNRSEIKLFLKLLDDLVEQAFADTESTASVPSTTDLVDKSRLIPVKNIADVFNSYNRKKQAALASETEIRYSSSRSKRDVKSHSSFVQPLNQKLSKSFVEGDIDSDITLSYHDLGISESLIGFTSKYNFKRYSDISESNSKEPIQSEYSRSIPDITCTAKKRKSSASASHVKFKTKAEDKCSGNSFRVIHQSDDIPSVRSQTERVSASLVVYVVIYLIIVCRIFLRKLQQQVCFHYTAARSIYGKQGAGSNLKILFLMVVAVSISRLIRRDVLSHLKERKHTKART